MEPQAAFNAANIKLTEMWADGECVLYRGQEVSELGAAAGVLVLRLTAERPGLASVDRLAREYSLREQLDSAWAVRPLQLVPDGDRMMLVLEDPGGVTLDRRLGSPMRIPQFLRLGIAIASALRQVHLRALIHKDLKPKNIFVDDESGRVRLTGFGLASQMPRERPAPDPPEFIAGTLAYMAPEQTGRMNRSVDSRSDLYALGVVFYQMLTGHLPFAASDPMEWIHCHIARAPPPPRERATHIPTPLSQIVTKLLSKNAEDRYQTAAGLEHDLRRCLIEWQTFGRIEMAAVGEADSPDRLQIPEKLYGRERELSSLRETYERVSITGAPELILISGYSGVGKSAIAHELQSDVVLLHGHFASGKFDQHKRDIPYAPIAEAFRSLMREVLSKSNDELEKWRRSLRDALGLQARFVSEVIPELKLIVGEQPPVPDLPAPQRRQLFQAALRRFIGAFAAPEHPLALFLDDLQWVDAATLDLLEDVMIRPEMRYLLLIGAYRDNESDLSHLLARKLEAIRGSGARVSEITLRPLAPEHLQDLIADALRCPRSQAGSLSQAVFAKTGGNPFFSIQFLCALADEGSIEFDPTTGDACWDFDRIHRKGYTANVVELIASKLGTLPVETQVALQQMACLGSAANAATLSSVLTTPEKIVHATLREAVRHGLIERRGGTYSFIHDRVQEAAYSTIPPERRVETHLRIGRLLVANTPSEQRDEAIFDIVNQLNRGATLIISMKERVQLADLNLIAGKRARASTAYLSALKSFAAGASILPRDIWERNHDLAFALEVNRAECEILTGDMAAGGERLTRLALRALTNFERATIASMRIDLYTTLDQSEMAVGACIEYLHSLGQHWSPHPTRQEAMGEYEQILANLDGRAIEDLADLPLMRDPTALATLDVLTKTFPAALFVDANLLSMAVCRAINLSLERGHCDGSCVAYVFFAKVAGFQFDNHEAGFRFARLGYDLIEKRGLERYQARTYLWFTQFSMMWTHHVRASRTVIQRAFEAATNAGDLPLVVYSFDHLNTNLIAAGDPLAEAQRQAEQGLRRAESAKFAHMIDIIRTQLGVMRSLRGLTESFGRFDDEQMKEADFERRFAMNSAAELPECWYWIRKLQVRFLAGEYAAAINAAERAETLLGRSAAMFETAEFHFYAALARAASCEPAIRSDKTQPTASGGTRLSETALASSRSALRQAQLEAIAAHRRQLELWAENCPDNFRDRAALVGAELARLEGRDLDAQRLYQQAIDSAKKSGFVHNEAIAYELAAQFYAALGFADIATCYRRNARYGYERWGADGKVRQFDDVFPRLGDDRVPASPTSTILTSLERLDLATIIKISHAVSGEIISDKLIAALMQMAVEHAGADRGALILRRETEPRVEAEAAVYGEAVTVRVLDAPIGGAEVPASVVLYVMRTRESVIVADAWAPNSFSADPFIRRRCTRSILCVPLVKQTALIGALYLENSLAPHVFTPTRVAILELLASQAAISLENTRLYSELEEREAKIRRLFEANIMGIFIWNHKGDIVEANQAFLKMVGYGVEDLRTGRLRLGSLTAPQGSSGRPSLAETLTASGEGLPREMEFRRSDGVCLPVLVGSAAFGGRGDEGVAFVVDLTEQRRAGAQVRESERRYQELKLQLEHANRVATIGQMSASIAHEVNQPIAASVTNAHTALRWLGATPPNLAKAREALGRVLENGNRAADVISGIRALVKKAPPRRRRVVLNETILEIIAVVESEARRNNIVVRTKLASNLPDVQGDEVQLQQLVLNLAINAIQAMTGLHDGLRELEIITERTADGGVLASVADSGIGLTSTGTEQLFEAFFTTKPEGLGMGLAICRSIAESHGGRLWATPNAPRGAIFRFTIPGFPPMEETGPQE